MYKFYYSINNTDAYFYWVGDWIQKTMTRLPIDRKYLRTENQEKCIIQHIGSCPTKQGREYPCFYIAYYWRKLSKNLGHGGTKKLHTKAIKRILYKAKEIFTNLRKIFIPVIKKISWKIPAFNVSYEVTLYNE